MPPVTRIPVIDLAGRHGGKVTQALSRVGREI